MRVVYTFHLRIGGGTEREVSRATYCAAERRCGFMAPHRGQVATFGFSCRSPDVVGRVGIRPMSVAEEAIYAATADATNAAIHAATADATRSYWDKEWRR